MFVPVTIGILNGRLLLRRAPTACVVNQHRGGARHHVIRVNTVDGEVVDRGCGSAGADVDDPDLLAGGGEELVAGVKVGGITPV